MASELQLKAIQSAKVLMVGAGGIGCELLKTLALSGFQDIHIVSSFHGLSLFLLLLWRVFGDGVLVILLLEEVLGETWFDSVLLS
ncbi:hypothetical protein HHK36_003081 [Tetracentron sinense]|uniref:THIF-type NAD/FAD binding fold domain-containing protein n=1 Tax=Tetracentron sinense TaxID=13715 RepID=A0A834ZRS2_TETSI|nr:hypothetical protein HHK36_003081 [Tetracentron sinense]